MRRARTAAEVFERYGEDDFRDGERRLVARLVEGDVRVIATGGGAFVDPRTRDLLNERAITVWLDAPVDVLAERTGAPRHPPAAARRRSAPRPSPGSPRSAAPSTPRPTSTSAAATARTATWSRRSSPRSHERLAE